MDAQTEAADTPKNGKAKGPLDGTRKRKSLRGEDAILAQLKDDVCTALDGVGSAFIRALHASRGREKGSIKIDCAWNPGGEKNDKKFKITPSLNVKGEAIERSADFVDNQIEMYP